ncbi:PP0621 family protein [Pseudacidovorax intermedius]|uniref:MYND finger n=1 Tax=Pseudacidovorax intermedius TaxID=433924 RepID=A0A370FKX1_9BURK|nr:PP0621 family protein [Pseudacidovorax intermedius]RDI28306.1 uncharacterized protein DFR41_10158 [Pseudacidovorax intermedius]
MKFLLVTLVVAVAIWIWRRNRQEELDAAPPPRPNARPAVRGPQRMVRCAHCGLHLPAADAVPGRHGIYCSDRHRNAAEP